MRIYNYFCFFLYLSFTSPVSASVDSITNSLIRKIAIEKEDTNKINLLNKYSKWLLGYKPDSAIFYAHQALKLAEKLDWKRGIGKSSNGLGTLYLQQANYDKTYFYYFKSLKIAEMLNDKNAIGSLFINFGRMHSEIGNEDKALQYFQKGLKIKKELKKEKDILIAYINLGILYVTKNDLSKAEYYFFLGLPIARKLRDSSLMSILYSDIGAIYQQRKKYPEAQKYISEALNLAEILKRKDVIFSCYIVLSNIAYDQKNFSKTISYITKGLTLSEGLKNYELEANANKVLFRTYSKLNRTQEALKYYDLYEKINESIHKEQSAKQIAELEARYKNESTEQKLRLLSNQNEIQLLKLEKNNYLIIGLFLICGLIIGMALLVIRQIKLKENQRAFLLEQKALRAQINPHFFSNALNSIQKLIPKSDTINAHEYLAKFSSLMRKILDNSDKAFVPIDDELSAVKLYLDIEQLRVDNGFDYEINIDPDIDIYSNYIPAMMIQPYIENAIWHGLMDKGHKGKIKLNVQKKENNIVFTIEDNGIGRILNTEQQQGKPFKNTPSGMQLVQDRINSINAMHKTKMKVIITDLMDSMNSSSGTKVEIFMSLNS